MKIRWGRGSFRIWVLLSVLWIAGAAWVETRPPPPGPWDLYADIPFPRNRAECEAAAADDPGVKVAACVRRVYDEMWNDAEKVAWVLVPPALLLIAGAAIGWAVRGFRPK